MTQPDAPIKVTESTFSELVKRYRFVIIDCWAEWCGPCHMIAPTIDALAKDYAGRVVFGKLNVDENRDICYKYSVMGIPTLLFFKNGELVDRMVGALPRADIEKKIVQYL